MDHLRLVLLLCFTQQLRAQSAAGPCSAPPALPGGYFVPHQQTYAHQSLLAYACDPGLKPALEGWWATSTCDNGTWSHTPRCIDEKACYPPNIPNAQYTPSQSGWYENEEVIRAKCDAAYEHRNYGATGKCENGTWSSLPVCDKSPSACKRPPPVPNAVLTGVGHQQVFPPDTKLQLHCADGYSVQGTNIPTSIICLDGNWTESPVCRRNKVADPGPAVVGGHGGGHSGGLGGGHSGGHSGGLGVGQGGGHGVGVGGGHGGGHSAGHGGSHGGGHGGGQGGGYGGGQGGGHGVGVGHGGGRIPSTGGGTHPTGDGHRGTGPVGGGSTAVSGPNEGGSNTVPVLNCGNYPVIQNGDVVKAANMFLKYKCNRFYTRVGLEKVVCYSDGSWSPTPTCKATYCTVDTQQYPELIDNGVKYVAHGKTRTFLCVRHSYWLTDHYSKGSCSDGTLTLSECCSWISEKWNQC